MRRAGAFASSALVAAFMLAACACACVAQSRVGEDLPAATSPQRAAAAGGVNAAGDVDEDFELNIAERRITEQSFFASTAVNVSAGALRLGVGVALGAGRIDVLLRNVSGRVRFRGSLDALRRVLDAHGATPAADPARRDVP